MLKGKAQWRDQRKQLAVDVDFLRHLQRQYTEKDELREELAQSKRELRRQQGSGSRMADYEREGMVKMMENGAVERGQLEAEVESLKARVRKLETEAELHKLQNKAPAGDMPLGKAEWHETYKSLARLLHPDKNDWPSADDPRTTAFRVAAELNEFYNK